MKPKITRDDVVGVFPELSDRQVVEILDAGATLEDLEEAAAYAAQADDVMGEERISLAGVAAAVYEIVMQGQEYAEEERRP